MKKKDVKDETELDKYYNQARKIKFADDIEITTVEQVKQLLLMEKFPTFYLRNGIHCRENKYRSIDDYFLLCKYYFPDKTIQEVSTLLIVDDYNLQKNDKNTFRLMYCRTIRKSNSAGTDDWYYGKSIEYKLKQSLELGFKFRTTFRKLINNEDEVGRMIK